MREFSTNLSGLNKIEKLGTKSIVKMASDLIKVEFQLGSLYYLTSNSDLYGYGANENGALGLGNIETQSNPILMRSAVSDFIAVNGILYVLNKDETLWKVGFSNTHRYLRYLNKIILGTSVVNDKPVLDALNKYNDLYRYFQSNPKAPACDYFKQLLCFLEPRKVLDRVDGINKFGNFLEVTNYSGEKKYLANDIDIPLNRKKSEDFSCFFAQDKAVSYVLKSDIPETKVENRSYVLCDRLNERRELIIKDNNLQVIDDNLNISYPILKDVNQMAAIDDHLVYSDLNNHIYFLTEPLNGEKFKNLNSNMVQLDFIQESKVFIAEASEKFIDFTFFEDYRFEFFHFLFYKTNENKLYRLTFLFKEYEYGESDPSIIITKDLIMENVLNYQAFDDSKLVIQNEENKFFIVSANYLMPTRSIYNTLRNGEVNGIKEFSVIFDNAKNSHNFYNDD